MSNNLTKARKDVAAELFKRKPGKLEPVDLKDGRNVPPGMTRAFRNNRYTVMIYDDTPTTHGPAVKALIQNHFNTPIQNHWAELRAIKNEIFGEEVAAVEYYPRESELMDTHNIYWLWIYPAGVLPTFNPYA